MDNGNITNNTNKFNFKSLFSNKIRVGIFMVVAVVLAIPITISLVGQQQDIRQRAFLENCTGTRTCDASGCSCDSDGPGGATPRYEGTPVPPATEEGSPPATRPGWNDMTCSDTNNPQCYADPARAAYEEALDKQQAGMQPNPALTGSPEGLGGNIEEGTPASDCPWWLSLIGLCSNVQNTPTPTPTSNFAPPPLQSPNATATPTNVPSGTPTQAPTVTSATLTPTRRPAIYNALFDLNDDGKINDEDLNILYAHFAEREGD